MLPVSGAEQLNTSGAHGTRPMISHSGAYSRLVKPSGARGELGKNKFQTPAARALGLSSSINVVGIHALPAARLVSISCKNRASLGYTCSAMNALRRRCKPLTLSLKSKFTLLLLFFPCVFVQSASPVAPWVPHLRQRPWLGRWRRCRLQCVWQYLARSQPNEKS